MKSLLARVRRLFFAGTVTMVFLLVVAMCQIGQGFKELSSIYSIVFSGYLMTAPIVYLVLVIISSVYIRKKGQFADVHKEKSFIVTCIRCIGSDFCSPWKCISGFITVFGKYPDYYPKNMIAKSKTISVFRFVWMIVIISLCVSGFLQIYDLVG